MPGTVAGRRVKVRLTPGAASSSLSHRVVPLQDQPLGAELAELLLLPAAQRVERLHHTNPYGDYGSVTPIRVATNTAGKPIKAGRFPQGIAISS